MSVPRAPRAKLLWVALFLGAALISGFTMLRGIDPFDEGLALQAARRVTEGQLPYADFQWAYGPGLPYLLAGLRDLFGSSLLDWRIARVLLDAGVAVTAFAIVRRETGSAPLAGLAWLVAVCALADPRSANPFTYALLFGLLAFAVATGGERVSGRRAAAAGVLIGLAAAFRIDFGLFAAAGVVAALALRPISGRARAVGVCAAAAAAVALAAYAPFLVAVGPADLYRALIGTSLRDSAYWSLPFPLGYDGSLSSPHGWKDALDFYVPLLLVIGSAAAALALALRWRSDRRAPWVAAGLLVLAVGFLVYLHSRTDEFHTQPLAVVLAILLPVSLAAARRPPRALAVVLAAVLALVALQAVGNRASALLRPPAMSRVHLPVADGVSAPPAEARALERTVALVDALVPAGEPIYVLPRRSDLVRVTAPVLYVLTGRDNPTPRDHGLLTGAAAQRSIVDALERSHPRAIVRWTDPTSSEAEPNLRGHSSGVHLVDGWVAAHYRLRQRAGFYDVLVPRRASP